MDECQSGNGGCHSQRKCVNTEGGSSCEDCATGWSNDGDKGCKGLDEGGGASEGAGDGDSEGKMMRII